MAAEITPRNTISRNCKGRGWGLVSWFVMDGELEELVVGRKMEGGGDNGGQREKHESCLQQKKVK